MEKLDLLRQKVDTLYTAKNPDADVWIDWSYENHVLFVANMAEKMATEHQANVGLVVAGALVHDIADAVMSRYTEGHWEKSLEIADSLLRESGFSDDEVTFVVNEIIKPHSCKELLPTTLEGKIMATADGAAHFLTDFYPLFCWRHYGPEDDYAVFKAWMLKKLEKDYAKKFFFDEVKQQVTPHYEALKLVFSQGK